MKKIQSAQSNLVNDTCNDCGSYADIGAVIDEHDTQLIISFQGDQAQSESAMLAKKAQDRFEQVAITTSKDDKGVTLQIDFSFSAEKMIFQLENSI